MSRHATLALGPIEIVTSWWAHAQVLFHLVNSKLLEKWNSDTVQNIIRSGLLLHLFGGGVRAA